MILNFNEFINESNNYKNIKSSDYIVLSNDDSFIDNKFTQLNKADSAPQGVHYTRNTEWIDWLNRHKSSLIKGKQVYKIEIDFKNILKINTLIEEINFEKEFGVPSKYDSDIYSTIKWNEVAKKYDGIDVKFGWPHMLSWLHAWKVSGGYIWNTNAIKNVIQL